MPKLLKINLCRSEMVSIRWVFLSFYCFSVIRCGFGFGWLVGRENTLSESPREMTSNSKMKTNPFQTNHRKITLRKLPDDSKVIKLTPEKREDIRRNELMNKDRLKSLRKDSQELRSMKMQLEEQRKEALSWSYFGSKPVPSYKEYTLCTGIESMVQKFDDRLPILKQHKLFSLKKIVLPNSNLNLMEYLVSIDGQLFIDPDLLEYKLPEDITETILEGTWKNMGDSKVNDLKQLIIHNKRFLDMSFNEGDFKDLLMFSWKYILTLLDFLFKHDLANRETVREFFLAPGIMKQLVRYAERRFQEDINFDILAGSPYLTEHWYWPLLHESFQALTKRDENLFTAYLLLDLKYHEAVGIWAQFYHFQGSFEWYSFFSGLYSQKYIRALGGTYEPRKLPYMDIRSPKDFSPDTMVVSVGKIVGLIGSPESPFERVTTLSRIDFEKYPCEILDFIDRCICSGVSKSLWEFANTPGFEKLQDFDNRFNLLILEMNRSDLKRKANGHYQYITNQYHDKWSKSKLFKSKFENYMNQASVSITQINEEAQRLRKKLGDEEFKTQHLHRIIEVKQTYKVLLDDLRDKYNDSFCL